MSDNRYDLSRAAQKAGGPCPVCGWKDGDGVKVCFASQELGEVTHQNSTAAASATMSESQRLLVSLRLVHAFASVKAREDHIASVAQTRREKGRFPPEWTDADEAVFLADYRRMMERRPIATDEPYCHWIQTMWHGFIECREPHDCGGRQIFAGAYHFKCSGCDVEVKLWEHGVDYDIG